MTYSEFKEKISNLSKIDQWRVFISMGELDTVVILDDPLSIANSLIAQDVGWLTMDREGVLEFNMNLSSTFYYACADGECIHPFDLFFLYHLDTFDQRSYWVGQVYRDGLQPLGFDKDGLAERVKEEVDLKFKEFIEAFNHPKTKVYLPTANSTFTVSSDGLDLKEVLE